MRLVFLRCPFSCESPHPSNTWFFYPCWTAIGPMLYSVSCTAWCREGMFFPQGRLTWMWCSRAAEHFTHSPTASPAPCPGGVWRLLVPEQSGTLSHWAGGDLCPSGQTGCVKQERPISAGISQSALAGLRGRAGYQHQQKRLLGAPLAPLAPVEPCLNSGSGERFHTWFIQSGACSKRTVSAADPSTLLLPSSGWWTAKSPAPCAQPASSSCGRNFSCRIISQRKCLSMN